MLNDYRGIIVLEVKDLVIARYRIKFYFSSIFGLITPEIPNGRFRLIKYLIGWKIRFRNNEPNIGEFSNEHNVTLCHRL